MRSFPWVIGAALVVVIAGGIGYWLGVGAHVATVAAPVAGTPVVYGFHWFGFPFFGFFFFLLFMFLIFAVIRRVAIGRRGGPGWHGAGPGGYGHGYGPGPRGFGGPGGWSGWSGKDLPPMADEMLQRWHRQAHGESQPPAPDSAGSGGSSTPPGPSSPSA